MSASNAQRILAASGDNTALALKMYWGAVLEGFRAATPLWDNDLPVIARQNVDTGKSWQFIMPSDTPESEYHTPGQEMLGQQIEFDEGTITIDDVCVVHNDIPIADEEIAHFSALTETGKAQGSRLARDMEGRLMALAVLSARTAARTKNGLTIHNGGNRVTNSGSSATAATAVTTRYPVSATGAQNFRADCAQLAQLQDDDFVPRENRFLMIGPQMIRVLGQDTTIFDVRYTPDTPNKLNRRIIGEIEGYKVLVTTNLPGYNQGYVGADTSARTTVPSKYNGVFNTTSTNSIPVAVALCGANQGRAAIGMAIKRGIVPTMVKDERRNTMFLKSEIRNGAGTLYAPSAGAIEVTA